MFIVRTQILSSINNKSDDDDDDQKKYRKSPFIQK